METLNQSLFLWINASPSASSGVLGLARVCAVYLVWLVPLTLLLGWRTSNWSARRGLLVAVAAALLAWLLAHALGALWPHPRPFMLSLGTNALHHAPSNSFPSNHLTFVWSVAAALLLQPRWRKLGGSLALFGLPVAVLCDKAQLWLIVPLLEPMTRLHQRVFAYPIRRGWVRH